MKLSKSAQTTRAKPTEPLPPIRPNPVPFKVREAIELFNRGERDRARKALAQYLNDYEESGI